MPTRDEPMPQVRGDRFESYGIRSDNLATALRVRIAPPGPHGSFGESTDSDGDTFHGAPRVPRLVPHYVNPIGSAASWTPIGLAPGDKHSLCAVSLG